MRLPKPPGAAAGPASPHLATSPLGCGWGEAPLPCAPDDIWLLGCKQRRSRCCPAAGLGFGAWRGFIAAPAVPEREGFREMAVHPVGAVPPGRSKGKSWIQLACPTGETTAGFGQRWVDQPRPELVAMLLRELRGPRATEGGEGRGWRLVVLSCIPRPGVKSCQKSHCWLKNQAVKPQ